MVEKTTNEGKYEQVADHVALQMKNGGSRIRLAIRWIDAKKMGVTVLDPPGNDENEFNKTADAP
jgi:hypothetical protein